LFQEEHFEPNQVLFKEGAALKYIYLIAEGEVRLTSNKNPYTQKYYKDNKIDSDSDKTLLANIGGTGNLSRTIVQNNLGCETKGQWLGEEYVLVKIPILYSALAIGSVKVLKINVQDFQNKLPIEV
jgi:CRP-like cAMP-binding protein